MFAMQLHFRLNVKKTIKEHFTPSVAGFVTYHRYTLIAGHISTDFHELCLILSEAWKKMIEPGAVCLLWYCLSHYYLVFGL
jgi:hypothetical protein